MEDMMMKKKEMMKDKMMEKKEHKDMEGKMSKDKKMKAMMADIMEKVHGKPMC